MDVLPFSIHGKPHCASGFVIQQRNSITVTILYNQLI